MKRTLALVALVQSALTLHCWSEGQRERDGARGTNARDGSGLSQPSDIPWQLPDEALELPAPSAQPASVRFFDWDPLPELVPQASTDLAAFFPEDAQLVGVAIDPRQAGNLPVVLEARTGLYQLGTAGAQLVFDLRASRVFGGTGDGSPPVELTDVAFDVERAQQTGQQSFALTAENDGFALALPSTRLDSYFCYFPSRVQPLPGPAPSLSQELREQGVAVVERTEAVALNPITSQIVAQPRTLLLDSGGVAGSELFVFDAAGGQPLGTWRLERSEFAAGGAAFLEQTYLTLGFGADLYFTGGWGETVVRQLHLSGVERITGLATQPDGDLLVLDGPTRRLLEVSVQQIADALGN
jgi:hypothetical protein